MLSRRLTIGLLVVGLGLIVGGGWALLRGGPTPSGNVANIESELRSAGATPTTTQPSLESPATTAPHAVGSDPLTSPEAGGEISPPVGLRIDVLEVDAPIGAYGVDQATGQMAVPENAMEVGWYRFGPEPGEPGSAVLAAHVDLAGSGPGVFFDLRTLEEGDSIVVVHEDGSESTFRVIARTTYEKDELPLDVVFSRKGPAVLTLITCGGDFNSSISRYDSNVVVYAVPDLGTEPTEGSTL